MSQKIKTASKMPVAKLRARGDLSPGPVIRFAHCRLRLCLQGKGSKAPLMA